MFTFNNHSRKIFYCSSPIKTTTLSIAFVAILQKKMTLYSYSTLNFTSQVVKFQNKKKQNEALHFYNRGLSNPHVTPPGGWFPVAT